MAIAEIALSKTDLDILFAAAKRLLQPCGLEGASRAGTKVCLLSKSAEADPSSGLAAIC